MEECKKHNAVVASTKDREESNFLRSIRYVDGTNTTDRYTHNVSIYDIYDI